MKNLFKNSKLGTVHTYKTISLISVSDENLIVLYICCSQNRQKISLLIKSLILFSHVLKINYIISKLQAFVEY